MGPVCARHSSAWPGPFRAPLVPCGSFLEEAPGLFPNGHQGSVSVQGVPGHLLPGSWAPLPAAKASLPTFPASTTSPVPSLCSPDGLVGLSICRLLPAGWDMGSWMGCLKMQSEGPGLLHLAHGPALHVSLVQRCQYLSSSIRLAVTVSGRSGDRRLRTCCFRMGLSHG